MRLSLTLAAPLLVLLATGGVQAQAYSPYSTSETDDGQECLVFNGVSAVRASQEAAARGIPLCDDVDLSITGSIAPANGYVVPESLVGQDDKHRN